MSRYRSEGPESSAGYESSASSSAPSSNFESLEFGSVLILARLTGLSTLLAAPLPSDRFKDDESAMCWYKGAEVQNQAPIWPARHPTHILLQHRQNVPGDAKSGI